MWMKITAYYFHLELINTFDNSCFSRQGRWELWDHLCSLEDELGDLIFNPVEIAIYHKEMEVEEALKEFGSENLDDLKDKQDVISHFRDENGYEKVLIAE